MTLVVLLACTITLAGGYIVGVACGVAWERSRRDAGGIAPHEALRPLLSHDAGEWGWP